MASYDVVSIGRACHVINRVTYLPHWPSLQVNQIKSISVVFTSHAMATIPSAEASMFNPDFRSLQAGPYSSPLFSSQPEIALHSISLKKPPETTHLIPRKQNLCLVLYRRYSIETHSTNMKCPFLKSHRPTRRRSDLVAILEYIDPRFRGDEGD